MRPEMEISGELVERMAEHIRQAVITYQWATDPSPWLLEARAIVALLPVPVDPDLIEARELWAVAMENRDGAAKLSCAADIRRGTLDDAPPMVAIRQALGRTLERSK